MGQQLLWPLPAELGHSPASIWEMNTELEIIPEFKVLELNLA